MAAVDDHDGEHAHCSASLMEEEEVDHCCRAQGESDGEEAVEHPRSDQLAPSFDIGTS